MGLFDKLKNAVNTAAESIAKAIDGNQTAKDPLADPIVKKYYDVIYGLMKTVSEAPYDAIKKYVEYQLDEPCDEILLKKALECCGGSHSGYRAITDKPTNDDKKKLIVEINKTLDTINQYRCTKEEAYNICYKDKVEGISAEFAKVLDVVEKHGFKHLKTGMNRIWSAYHEGLPFETYYDIVYITVRNKFFESNSIAESVLRTCLEHATYRYHKVDGSDRIAAIALRALNFEKYGDNEEEYKTITKEDCLGFVLNSEEFKTKADKLTEKYPFDEKDYNAEFADYILRTDIMAGSHSEGEFAETERWMPRYKKDTYYADKLCNFYWKYVAESTDNDTTDANEIYDMIWEYIKSKYSAS